MSEASNQVRIGLVSAYGEAKAAGYTGTKEEFGQLLADFTGAAQTAVDAADSASGSARDAGDAKDAAVSAKNTAQAAAASASAVYGTNLIAVDYSNLTFPVVQGTYCIYSGKFYSANTDIPTNEVWNSSHWTETKIGSELARCYMHVSGTKLIIP